MSQSAPVTPREAVLTSLLLHAAVFILVLLFPGVLTWRESPRPRAAQDDTIPLAFLQEPPSSVTLGDSGDTRRSDPRPVDAPEPRNADPYSRGNNPNRFMAPPVAGPASPEPGNPGSESPPQPAAPESSPENSSSSSDSGSTHESSDRGTDREVWRVPPAGESQLGGQGASGRNGTSHESLKEALGRMSLGRGTGGEPLRYDNPVGGLSGPTGGLSFDTPGFDWGPYARRIYWIIWTNWTRGWPPAARAGLAGVVTVRFRIQRDGTISGISVMKESGTPAFDTCATLALEASSPLPALPVDFPKDSEGITARFLYNMESASDDTP